MNSLPHPSIILGVIHSLIVVGISVRVIMRRPNTGVALAWLFVVGVLPYFGTVAYLLLELAGRGFGA